MFHSHQIMANAASVRANMFAKVSGKIRLLKAGFMPTLAASATSVPGCTTNDILACSEILPRRKISRNGSYFSGSKVYQVASDGLSDAKCPVGSC